MHELKRCPECETPVKLSKPLKWTSGGEIYPGGQGMVRQIFFETDVIDTIFYGISETIGMPIDHIVIESSRRESFQYQREDFPAWAVKVFNSLYRSTSKKGYGKILGRMLFLMAKNASREAIDLGTMHGLGRNVTAETVKIKGLESYRTQFIRNPYSPMLYAGDILATFEIMMGTAQLIECKALGENTYKYVVSPGEGHRELEGRLERRRFVSKPGDMVYERCPSCGIPSDLAECDWDLQEGTIADPIGVRLATFHAFTLEAVLRDLETELGELIPKVVIETLATYTKTNFRKDEWMSDASGLKQRLAVRGLGNLTRFEMGEDRLTVTIENSCVQFLTIGIIQAVFETHVGKKTQSLDWDLSDEGILDITVACA